jgi:aerobic carbon-monoxide dehydrogenase medium subunit
VKPVAFDYFAPQDTTQALSLLAAHGAEAKVLAGGQSLVPLMNFRLARPAYLVDINRIDALSGIEACGAHVKIGATARQHAAACHPVVKEQLPILAEAIGYIGHLAIQNRGTIGGSLAHADPAAELPVVALALDALIHLQRAGIERTVTAEEFFRGYLTTVLQPDELLTGALFCVPPICSGWCFMEVARRHGDFALVAVATVLSLDPDGRITSARVALGGVGPVPIRARAAERILVGESPADDLFRAAAATVGAEIEPPEDIHASAGYRRHLAGVLVRRSLTSARASAIHV